MDDKLKELNKQYGDSLFFQKMLNAYLKTKFKTEIIWLKDEKRRRLQNG